MPAQAQPQAGAGVGHGGVWRYLYMHKHTEVTFLLPLHKLTPLPHPLHQQSP